MSSYETESESVILSFDEELIITSSTLRKAASAAHKIGEGSNVL